MNRASYWMAVVLLQLAAAPDAGAQMTLSGNPQTLTVRSAVAGFAPDPAWDETSSYSVAVTEFSNIVAQLDAPLPEGVTLRLRLVPPSGASSNGFVVLATEPRTLITLIPPGSYSGLGITYELAATVTAGVVPLNTRQITFSLVPAQ